MPATLKDKERTRDLLTGLSSYKAFLAAFDKAIATTEEKNQPLSLGLVDIDFFKRINDEHGHLVGDAVLQAIAQHLARSISDRGTVFRYGGEEFTVLFPNTEKEQAFLLLENARSAFDQDHVIETDKGGIALKPTFSAGLASYPDDGTRAKDVLRKADGALYRAKVSGRNRVCLSREDRMVTKTSHYTQEQLERLGKLAKGEGVGEAVLLREALDDLLKKYDDQQASYNSGG
jgi:diguanylate cyclase (GGDEF)-like protein